MRKISDKKIINEQYKQYLTDESRLEGKVVANLYFPQSSEDVVSVVNEVSSSREALVISSGRTGIVGGAVPCGVRNLISLEEVVGDIFIGYDEEWFARVPAGISLETFNNYLQKGKYKYLPNQSLPLSKPNKLFYPVNPTEATARIGGTVATNASGSRSFFYGATRNWVRRIKVVLANGTMLNLRRGENRAKAGILSLEDNISITVSDINMPTVKNTAGYYLSSDVDAIDLFIGGEGTLGIITEVDIRLISRPKNMLGQIIFFKEKKQLLEFLMSIISPSESDFKPVALEYFDNNSLNLLRQRREEEGSSSLIVNIPDSVEYALYVENTFEDDDELESLFNIFDQLLKDVGSSAEDSWAGFDEKTIEQMTIFRHAVPEAINSIIGQRKASFPEIRKISSDMAVPPDKIEHILEVYDAILASSNLEYVIFGHIGDGHVHVNILPQNADEIESGYKLFNIFAREVVACGGSVSAEHGIGRLKKEFLAVQYPKETIELMKNIKRTLDEKNLLNPGVLFDMLKNNNLSIVL